MSIEDLGLFCRIDSIVVRVPGLLPTVSYGRDVGFPSSLASSCPGYVTLMFEDSACSCREPPRSRSRAGYYKIIEKGEAQLPPTPQAYSGGRRDCFIISSQELARHPRPPAVSVRGDHPRFNFDERMQVRFQMQHLTSKPLSKKIKSVSRRLSRQC